MSSFTAFAQEDAAAISTDNQRIAVDLILDQANLAMQKANYSEAIKFINSASEIATDSAVYASTQLSKSRLLIATNQYEKADIQLDDIKSLLDVDSEDYLEYMLLKAFIFLENENYIRANQYISRIEKLDNINTSGEILLETKLRKAQLDLAVENESRAAVSLLELTPLLEDAELFELSAQANYLLATIYEDRGELEDAGLFLDRSIYLAETYDFDLIKGDIYKLKSSILKQQDRLEESILFLEKYYELTNKSDVLENGAISSVQVEQLKRENEWLKEENMAVNAELKGHDTSYILLCVFITLLSLLTLSLFKNNKLRAKSNSALENKNSALIDERDRAQDAAKIKADFLSTITHELRTPMYAVTGLTHLLLETNPRKDQREHLETLQSSGEYLLSLIDNILDFNKLEANKVELESIPFDLKKRIQDITVSLKGQSSDHKNKLHISYDNSIPTRLAGDPVKVSQILINLIGNAIKFTRGGDIWIRAQRVETQGHQCKIHFEVEDNGKGISGEKQQAIFENFTQEGSSVTREYGGTGLGLAIVKNLVELMGGNVQLESKVGKGSKFSFDITFDLPDSNKFYKENGIGAAKDISQGIISEITNETIEPIESNKPFADTTTDTPASQETAPVPAKEPSGSQDDVISSKPPSPKDLLNKRILVVEDNKINQMITRKILEGKNFNCAVANNGLEAVEMVNRESFDLILMDIHMPVMDGKEATKKIRSFDREIPIIALTAVTLNESEKEFYEIGFDDIIPKPFKMDDFFSKIQRAFSNYQVL
ncbi:ATP-binding protein [Nonlabens xiamenensis]|uniref:ATP-binding protein n=1 Tax=Nonlabens xiamenensis TaxID=2341043 RepID=UPI001F0BB873|nr:ATP-binding protein [Nonlabens xiamenensis]